jgi:hypothetical protein
MSWAFARQLAAQRPDAKLPCPVCAASLNAENLDKHLAKVHADATEATGLEWRGKGALGLFPCAVRFDGDSLVLRHTLGLFQRRVALPCAIETGARFRTRPEAYATEYNHASVEEKAGRYLRLVGAKAITIGCRHSTLFKAHWSQQSWREGGRRQSVDLVIDRAGMVAIEYELARRGLLALA